MSILPVRVVEILGDGLALISYHGNLKMWSRRKLRKDVKCTATGVLLKSGQYHYGPIGNMSYRYARLNSAFIDGK